jgi:predicted regulator of Ras-like GTPase activity (Roadblock/LC7/MglB family)
MEQAKSVIESLAREEGVSLAMIVSRDGFILEMEAAPGLTTEPETVGAVVSSYWASADSMGLNLELGGGLNGMIEFDGAVVSTALIKEEDLILTLVTDRSMHAATARYLTVKFSELLTHVL